ncbi:hypothetical protein B0H11DRAFT_1941390 [Mycena galericulata]|nr:hypothetical protein B0H11DRAFT_1941390 [Mycena galericulata]
MDGGEDYEYEDLEHSIYGALAELESQYFDSAPPKSQPTTSQATSIEDLRRAARKSESSPFFTRQIPFDIEIEEDQADVDDENDGPAPAIKKDGLKARVWFKKPKRMPEWLYHYFGDTIQPLISQMNGKSLVQPKCYAATPPSLWVDPPDPVFTLSRRRFDPVLLYRPRVCLWLPHFLVHELLCPKCGNKLEKNGAVAPRRVTGIDASFYIVTWAYYCRNGCKAYFHGWNRHLLRSLPAFVRMSFPAVISHQSGLSHEVMSILRVGNQHKMGPSGVRSLLFEMHTLRFNTLCLQYLEAIFEQQRGVPTPESESNSNGAQSTLFSYMPRSEMKLPPFGNFDDPQGYAGFVPSEHYLADMMNRAIESDESDADQLTGCLDADILAPDDSHKIIKHIAKYDGVPIFTALWTCMSGEYIRAQVLTLTKGHEERIGPLKSVANSLKTYGHDDPKIDKALFYGVWPTLSQKLTPMATAHGLGLLELPQNLDIKILETPARVEALCASLMASVDDDAKSHLCVSLDAEWNVSRTVGVSIVQIAPHSMPGCIYIVPVHKFTTLPPSFLRLLISNRVFKTGVGVKGDLTRLKKQFPQLAEQGSFNIIDLKEYAVQRGIIGRQDSGALDVLVKKVLGKHLVKDDPIRKSEDWEGSLRPEMKTYAALDVFASRLVFEEISKIPPIDAVTIDSPVGTPVALLVQEGGAIAAYGKISAVQPPSFAGIRVHTPNRNRILVDVDSVLIPSAAAIFHQLPTSSKTKRTAAGAYTFAQLQSASSSSTFCVVASLSLLSFDRRREPTHATQDLPANDKPDPAHVSPVMQTVVADTEDSGARESDNDSDSESEANFDEPNDENDYPSESVKLQMLEAHADVCGGTKRAHDSESESPDSEESKFLADLRRLIEAPPDVENVYTRMKKDLFHAFRMIPMSGDHGMRAEFTRALRDHLMRWDPTARTAVDKICRTKFHRTFDEMLARSPRFIKQRVPRYVPPPSVLVPAIQHVYNMFGNAPNAKNGEPLFTKEAWKKAAAVLELAREGYLSDPEGVVLYEKAGVDEDGLQKWNCKRGTNKVEGGPHSDIYRKFGALHAGARLTVGARAWAKHVYGVDWEYHHNLALINRTSFLLNYLSDIIDGATSYSGWINGDLYERTEERFGICPIPDSMLSESIRIRFSMEPYSDDAAHRYPLNKNDDWLRQRQGLALPTLPPTTAEARKYFFSQMRRLITQGDGKINYENFAKQWNSSADGKYRFYVTTEVLLAYAKTWDKSNNIRASRELNAKNMDLISRSRDVFAASDLPIPTFTTGTAKSIPPSKAVINLDGVVSVPDSIATSFAISRPMRVSPAGTSTERVSVGLPLNARNTVETRDLMGLRGNSSRPESSSGPTEPEERSEPPDSSWELFPGGDLDMALDKTPLADSELFSESGGFQSEFEIDNPQEQNDALLGTSTGISCESFQQFIRFY